MIHLKATCKACKGTGNSIASPISFCDACNGKGVLILTEEDWDIELEQRPKVI